MSNVRCLGRDEYRNKEIQSPMKDGYLLKIQSLRTSNDAKPFIDSSKTISSYITYKSIKVTPDLILCQRRMAIREAIELHDSVTANNQLQTVCNTVNGLELMNNKHDVTSYTAGQFVDPGKSSDRKPLNKIRIPTATKKSKAFPIPDVRVVKHLNLSLSTTHTH